MNLQIFNDIYDGFKAYMEEKCEFKPQIRSVPPKKPQYPLVVLQEIGNNQIKSCFNNTEPHSSLSWEINIFAEDGVYDGIKYEKMRIARSIAQTASNYFEQYLKAPTRTFDPSPNIDITIYRITLRYSKRLDEKRLRLY